MVERTIRRTKPLLPFSLSLDEFEQLILRLSKFFGDREKHRLSITFSLPREKIKFKSVDEIRSTPGLPARVTDFGVFMIDGDRTISVDSQSLLRGAGSVTATGDNEAWCSSACEECRLFMNGYRTFSWWIPDDFIWSLIAGALIGGPLLAAVANGRLAPTYAKTFAVVFGIAAALALSLRIARSTIAPNGSLVIDRDRLWLRKHQVGVMVALTIVGIAVTILAVFLGRGG